MTPHKTHHVDDASQLQHEKTSCVKRVVIVWLEEIDRPHINELHVWWPEIKRKDLCKWTEKLPFHIQEWDIYICSTTRLERILEIRDYDISIKKCNARQTFSPFISTITAEFQVSLWLHTERSRAWCLKLWYAYHYRHTNQSLLVCNHNKKKIRI